MFDFLMTLTWSNWLMDESLGVAKARHYSWLIESARAGRHGDSTGCPA
jgi:hypothetical protein